MSTVDRVQAAMLRGLLRGEHAPGTWLRQQEVAERLSVSTVPVREALQRLAASGLLRFEPNRGAVVPRLTADDAVEIYALRRAIEPQLLARAVPRLTIVDLAEAEMALGDAMGSVTEANWRFHRALYAASGWERGLAIAETLHAAVAPYVLLYTRDLDGGRDSDLEHRALLDGCRAGDVTTVLEVLEQHLAQAEDALVASLTGPGTGDPAAQDR